MWESGKYLTIFQIKIVQHLYKIVGIAWICINYYNLKIGNPCKAVQPWENICTTLSPVDLKNSLLMLLCHHVTVPSASLLNKLNRNTKHRSLLRGFVGSHAKNVGILTRKQVKVQEAGWEEVDSLKCNRNITLNIDFFFGFEKVWMISFHFSFTTWQENDLQAC